MCVLEPRSARMCVLEPRSARMCVLESRSARSRACTIALRADRVHVLAHDQWRVRVADVRGVELHAQLAAVLLIFPGSRRAHVCARAAAGPDCRGLVFLRLYTRARGAGAMSWAGAGACAGGCWCAPHAAAAEVCAYAHGDVHCEWCDDKSGSGHEINGGLHKCVASDPSGKNVYILALQNGKLETELETMRELCMNFGVTCIPAIKSNVTLSGETLEHALRQQNHAKNASMSQKNGWFSMLRNAYLNEKSVQLITEENTGLTLTTNASDVTSQCDPLSTCLHMCTFLSEVFSMMHADVAYFHGDLHENNITWKLEENTLTRKNGIRFYLIDWSEAQQIDANTTELKAIQNAYQLSNLHANSANTKPPEFTMFAMLILFLVIQHKRGNLDSCIETLDKLKIQEAEVCFRHFHNGTRFSLLKNLSKNYNRYISKSEIDTLWEKVKYMFKQVLKIYMLKEKIISLNSYFASVKSLANMNIAFSDLLSNVLLRAFYEGLYDSTARLAQIWKTDLSSSTPALALMQRMQAWALSCNIGKFWYDNILDPNEHYRVAWDVWEKILLPMRTCEKGWFDTMCREIQTQQNELTIGLEYTMQHAVGAQACARCPCEGERACMDPGYTARDAYHTALHAGAAEACVYQLGVDNCLWCDCDDGRYGPETHTINKGTYKVVADAADGTNVCMLVNDDDDIEQELELMRKLRNELHISCVPLVEDSSRKLTLDEEKKWLKEIQNKSGVDRRIITALETSILQKENVLKLKKKIEETESELAGYTEMLQNGPEDDASRKDIERMMTIKTKYLERLKPCATDYDTWYIEQEFVGHDLKAMILHGAAATNFDYIETCRNLLALLKDVAKLIKHDCKIFNCDIKLQNLTCQSQYNPATQKNGLRFYVIDWGGGQQLQPDTEIPCFLVFFFKQAELRNDRRQQIPDEFVACFMCFYICITDKDKKPKEHLQNFAESECPLQDVWKRVCNHHMFQRFRMVDTQQTQMWQSIQRFCDHLCGTLWFNKLERLRDEFDDDDRAKEFMYFMLDYFRFTFEIDTRKQALVPMMQRVECWAYGHALSFFWKEFFGEHIESNLRTLHENVTEQLETLISNRNSFDTLNGVMHNITNSVTMKLCMHKPLPS